jgi:hypothetical protein
LQRLAVDADPELGMPFAPQERWPQGREILVTLFGSVKASYLPVFTCSGCSAIR